jgi:hypothetical protein
MCNTGRVVVAMLLSGMGQLAGQTAPFSMPAWLEPYAGASVETKTSRGMVTATYETAAPVTDVVAHYGELFAEQGVRFRPGMYGTTAVIHGDVPGCGLSIRVRKKAAGASVQITATQRPIIPKVTQQDIRHAMGKYDQPVYPTPKTAMPALRWPSWLTTCDDVDAKIRRGVDHFKLEYLETEFDSAQERDAILQFYVDLLNSNGYPVGSPVTPSERPAWVEGTRTFDGARRFVIRVELTPKAAGVHVELRITAHI